MQKQLNSLKNIISTIKNIGRSQITKLALLTTLLAGPQFSDAQTNHIPQDLDNQKPNKTTIINQTLEEIKDSVYTNFTQDLTEKLENLPMNIKKISRNVQEKIIHISFHEDYLFTTTDKEILGGTPQSIEINYAEDHKVIEYITGNKVLYIQPSGEIEVANFSTDQKIFKFQITSDTSSFSKIDAMKKDIYMHTKSIISKKLQDQSLTFFLGMNVDAAPFKRTTTIQSRLDVYENLNKKILKLIQDVDRENIGTQGLKTKADIIQIYKSLQYTKDQTSDHIKANMFVYARTMGTSEKNAIEFVSRGLIGLGAIIKTLKEFKYNPYTKLNITIDEFNTLASATTYNKKERDNTLRSSVVKITALDQQNVKNDKTLPTISQEREYHNSGSIEREIDGSSIVKLKNKETQKIISVVVSDGLILSQEVLLAEDLYKITNDNNTLEIDYIKEGFLKQNELYVASLEQNLEQTFIGPLEQKHGEGNTEVSKKTSQSNKSQSWNNSNSEMMFGGNNTVYVPIENVISASRGGYDIGFPQTIKYKLHLDIYNKIKDSKLLLTADTRAFSELNLHNIPQVNNDGYFSDFVPKKGELLNKSAGFKSKDFEDKKDLYIDIMAAGLSNTEQMILLKHRENIKYVSIRDGHISELYAEGISSKEIKQLTQLKYFGSQKGKYNCNIFPEDFTAIYDYKFDRYRYLDHKYPELGYTPTFERDEESGFLVLKNSPGVYNRGRLQSR